MPTRDPSTERRGSSALRALRGWLRAPSTIVAGVLVVVGLAFVYLESQSTTRVYWTGDTAVGTVRDGLVFYRVDGSLYTIDTDKPPARPTAITVFYDPSDPSKALYDTPTRWVEGVEMLVWFVAAAALLVIAPLRERRRRRRAPAEPSWVHTYAARRQSGG